MDIQYQLLDLLVNETNSAIYVSDVETYEIYYINDTARKMLHKIGKDCSGQKCYSFLFGFDKPCPFCKLSKMQFNEFVVRDFIYPLNNNVYKLKGKLLNWNGTKIHVEYIDDITQERVRQQQLVETKAVLAEAMRQTTMSIWEYDVEKKQIIQRENSQNIHGFGEVIENVPESLIESGYVHPKFIDEYRKLFEALSDGTDHIELDSLAINKDRTGYWWERIIYFPIESKNGKNTKYIGASVDVTEQKTLEKNYDEFKQLFPTIENGIIFNVTQDTLDFLKMKVKSVRELSNGNMSDFFSKSRLRIPDNTMREEYDKVFDRDCLLQSYIKGNTEQSMETLYKLDDGEYRYIRFPLKLTRNPRTGDIMGYSYIDDIHEAYLTRAVVDKVVSQNFSFIMLLNLALNRVRVISKAPGQNFGDIDAYTDYEHGVIRFCDYAVIPYEQEDAKKQMSISYIKQQLENVEQYTFSVTVRMPEDKLEFKRFTYSYLSKDLNKVLITIEDITQLVKKEEEERSKLVEALHVAEQANTAKSGFLSNMSHDMRTPMNAIIGFSNIAYDENADIDLLRTYMEKINSSGRYLLSLINEVLDMSKIENNKMKLHLEPVAVQEFFSDVLAIVKPMFAKKQITFLFTEKNMIAGKLGLLDKLRTQQIFVNILSNAAKFTPIGGIVECSMECISFDGEYAYDRVIVHDSGCGMSEEFLQKAFNPFEQEHCIQSSELEGTGLGLSIVKNLIELMGGSISLTSKRDIGTEVTLYFKTKLVDVNHENCQVNDDINSTESMNGKRILLCEDHPLNIEISMRLLKKQGLLVDVAQNGQIGLDKFIASPMYFYDAVLMDIRMPIMDGLETTRNIRALDREDAKIIPIIAMTANAFDEDVELSRDAGMNAHLAKPIDSHLLYDTLNRWIGNKK